jgi:hypothetical protein
MRKGAFSQPFGLQLYSCRFEFQKDGAADETSVSPGKGVTNWPLVLRQALKSGTKKFYIEDEAKNAIDQIPVTIDYLKSLK